MRILSLLLIAALAASNVMGAPGRRACYYTNWAGYWSGDIKYNIEDIPGDLCTHLVYGFSTISDSTWEMTPSDKYLDITQEGYKRFAGLKDTYPDVKTLISVGGWGSGSIFSQMASLTERRTAFVQSVVKFLNDYNFDGVEVDWEFPGSESTGGKPEDKQNFLSLLHELSDAFTGAGKNWELTVAVSTNPAGMAGYDVADICSVVDSVSLMTYDFHGHWDNFADVHTPLHRRPEIDVGPYEKFNVEDGVQLWVDAGCTPAKMTVGMAFYGNTFTLEDPTKSDLHAPSTGAGSPGPYTNATGFVTYFEICKMKADDPSWTDRRDDVGLVPFTNKDDQWIGYEDVDSIKEKVTFVKDNGLQGAMIFAVDYDDYLNGCGQGKNPLMTAIHDGLKDYVVA